MEYNEKLEALLEKLDGAETDEEIGAIGRKLLELDPDSPYGRLAVWETLDDDESMEQLDMLREALETIRAAVESKDAPAFIEDDRDAQVYCTVLMNLGYALLADGQTEEAYEAAKELANFDDEGYFPSRTLLYRCMLDLDLYAEILETLSSDPLESVAGEHARAIAMMETGAQPKDIREAVNYAISLAPDVPFFLLGIWDFPEDDDDVDEDTEETMQYAAYLSEPWSRTDERLAELGGPTFMFGYLTERLDDQQEIALLREGYKTAGLEERVETAKKKIAEMIKRNEDPEEVDAVALGETEEIIEELSGE